MSIVFRKVRVESRSNGSFRQYGLLVMNNAGNVWYVTNATNVDLGALTLTVPADVFTTDGHCNVRCSSRTYPNTSFVSIVRLIDAGEIFPFFSDCILRLEGQAAELPDGSHLDVTALLSQNTAQTAPAAQTAQGQQGATDTSLMSGVCIKPAYAQDITYTGFGSYHGHTERGHFNRILHPDKPWRIGVELEVYARTSSAYNEIINSRSNWFQCERDGSLRESSLGIEMKTIPLRACDAKSVDFWNEPMARLKTLAKSKGCTTTGLHVHIGKEALGSNEDERRKTLAKLQLFYVYMVEDDPEAHRRNVVICGRERGYGGSLDDAKCSSLNTLKAWSKDGKIQNMLGGVSDAFKDQIGRELRKDNNRWDINTATLSSYGTIEFRKADGSISKTRLAAVVTWWEQMVLYCRETPWNELNFEAFFRKVTSENPCVAYFFNTDEEA